MANIGHDAPVALLAAALRPAPFSVAARLAQLVAGLIVYGIALALMVQAGLGLAPWDVLHQGLAQQTHLAIGTWAILVGLAVLLLWIPLRLRPGIGTLANAVVIGSVMDVAVAVGPAAPPGIVARAVYLVAGVVLSGIATGAYIGAALGPGPRDGLMVGIAARGHSIGVVRTSIEVTVLVVGFLLGGNVGIGTVLYGVTIGPMAHVSVPYFTRQPSTAALEVAA